MSRGATRCLQCTRCTQCESISGKGEAERNKKTYQKKYEYPTSKEWKMKGKDEIMKINFQDKTGNGRRGGLTDDGNGMVRIRKHTKTSKLCLAHGLKMRQNGHVPQEHRRMCDVGCVEELFLRKNISSGCVNKPAKQKTSRFSMCT